MRLNISSKIILLLSVTIVFVLSIGFHLIILKESERQFNEMRKDALAISSTIQESIGKIMSDLQSDRDYMQILTERLGDIAGVKWVEVFDREATIIAHTNKERVGGKPLEIHELYVKEILKNGKPIEEEDKQSGRYNRFVPVYDITQKGEETVIGVVELVLDMNLVFKKVAALRLKMILTVIVLILTLLGLNLWFLRKIVVLPIRKLLDMTKKVAKGNLTQRLEITSHDELGQLGTSFNKMVEDLETTTTSIENLNREITERKQAEERTKSIAHILEDSLNEIYIFDAKTLRFIQVNKGGRLNLGYSMEELSSLTPLDLKPEFTVGSFAKKVEPLRTGKKKKLLFTTVHRRKDGSLYDVEVHLQLSVFQSSPAFVAIILDITERRNIEEALLQSEKLKSIGTITSGVAHEFNNLLAIISGNIQLLERTYRDHGGLTDALRTIKRATDDGAEISSKMLEFTRTDQDTKEFVSSDIRDLITQSIDFTMPRWKNEAQARGINYKIDTENMKRVSSILCNPTELREIFINIIINALDAMPEGGSLSFSTWSGDDTVFVGISDTGKGMSEDVKKYIFDPFFTTKTPVGTGLGMSMAYGITTRHGGKIEVESELGKGSTFTLQFPTATKAVSPIVTPEPDQETNKKNLRILVVDDEEAICDILDKFLSGSGHKVKTVDNGADAINIIKTEYFDLVLCDLSMPNVSGYDVVKVLNGLEKRQKIGIITGWGDEFKPAVGEEFKVDFVVKKPFDFSALSKHINDVFDAG